jgi:hypothetical protein
VLIPIHAGAALKHHFIDRDDVFHGMLPVVPQLSPRRTRWQRRWRALEKRVAFAARTLGVGLRRASLRAIGGHDAARIVAPLGQPPAVHLLTV